jgi:hypothetical protein
LTPQSRKSDFDLSKSDGGSIEKYPSLPLRCNAFDISTNLGRADDSIAPPEAMPAMSATQGLASPSLRRY